MFGKKKKQQKTKQSDNKDQKTKKAVAAEATSVRDEAEQEGSIQAVDTAVENSFFYTNDKFINSLDTEDVMAYAKEHYPNLSTSSTDTMIKKSLNAMLDNDQFMLDMLQYFNISIYDFFKMLYKSYASLFRGSYLKKLKAQVEGKKYAKVVRTR